MILMGMRMPRIIMMNEENKLVMNNSNSYFLTSKNSGMVHDKNCKYANRIKKEKLVVSMKKPRKINLICKSCRKRVMI